MPKNKEDKLNILTTEQRQMLIELGDKIAKAEKSIALLKELGLGTIDLENKLEWAKTRRDTLLAKG